MANLGEANDITQRLIQATEPQNRSLLPNDLGASSRILTAVIEVLENNNSTDEVWPSHDIELYTDVFSFSMLHDKQTVCQRATAW